jgi:hypothetical protein
MTRYRFILIGWLRLGRLTVVAVSLILIDWLRLGRLIVVAIRNVLYYAGKEVYKDLDRATLGEESKDQAGLPVSHIMGYPSRCAMSNSLA